MSQNSPSSSPSIADQLDEQLARAREQLERLEKEYAVLLADPGAIQEDRDTTRQLLEEARGSHEVAERALSRFRDGIYGICVRCNGDIGAERLEALPGVETCIACHGQPL
jgi:DnaK suppressor protein